MRTPCTTPGVPDNAPAGPTGRNTCENCEASFTDNQGPKWSFKQNHEKRCRVWKAEWEPKRYCKETKKKPVTQFPPDWHSKFTYRLAHEPRWKIIAEEEQDRRLKVQEEASSTPIGGQKTYDELRAILDNADAKNKAKEQAENSEDSLGEENTEKKGKGQERQESADVETTGDDSGNRTTGQESGSDSTNNGRTSQRKWADEDEDDNFSPRIPLEWKTEHAGNEKPTRRRMMASQKTTRPRRDASPFQVLSILRRQDLLPHPLRPWYTILQQESSPSISRAVTH